MYSLPYRDWNHRIPVWKAINFLAVQDRGGPLSDNLFNAGCSRHAVTDSGSAADTNTETEDSVLLTNANSQAADSAASLIVP